MPNHASKTCRKCGEVKPLSEFTRDRSKADGHRSQCRACEHERDRLRYLANREAKLQYQRAYYQANDEAVRDYQRQYREDHPEKIRERGQRYYQANRDVLLEQARQRREADPERQRESHARWLDRLRDAVFEHYGRSCACCGATERLELDHVNGDGAQQRRELFGSPQRGGIERFYLWLVRQNFPDEPPLQVLCYRCNRSKRSGERCRLDHDTRKPTPS